MPEDGLGRPVEALGRGKRHGEGAVVLLSAFLGSQEVDSKALKGAPRHVKEEGDLHLAILDKGGQAVAHVAEVGQAHPRSRVELFDFTEPAGSP